MDNPNVTPEDMAANRGLTQLTDKETACLELFIREMAIKKMEEERIASGNPITLFERTFFDIALAEKLEAYDLLCEKESLELSTPSEKDINKIALENATSMDISKVEGDMPPTLKNNGFNL